MNMRVQALLGAHHAGQIDWLSSTWCALISLEAHCSTDASEPEAMGTGWCFSGAGDRAWLPSTRLILGGRHILRAVEGRWVETAESVAVRGEASVLTSQ